MDLWPWHCRNREKKKFCDKLIVAMPLSKQGEIFFFQWQSNCDNDIAEIGRKKKICENLIVAIALPKQGNKFFFLAIVAMTLPKMGGKKIKKNNGY